MVAETSKTPAASGDAQRLSAIKVFWGKYGSLDNKEIIWLLAQAAQAQGLRAALEQPPYQHCGWCFLSPSDKCERPGCPAL